MKSGDAISNSKASPELCIRTKMKSALINKLNRTERKILYWIYKMKFLIDRHPFSLGALPSEYIEKFDTPELEQMIEHLIQLGYIVRNKSGDFGIPNVRKLQEIKKIFWKRRGWDWIWNKVSKTWDFLWKHIIITIIISVIVSIITAYITTKFFSK